jgi:uncharacterized Tic20 family protein
MMNAHSWAMLCHLAGLTGYLGNGIGSIVVPVILWAIKKDESPFIDEQGKEAINFNISITLYAFALGVLTIGTLGAGIIVAVPMGVLLLVFHFVMTIMAAIKADKGEYYRYPLTIRFIK